MTEYLLCVPLALYAEPGGRAEHSNIVQILEKMSRQEEARLASVREKNYLDSLANATKQAAQTTERVSQFF